MKGKRFSEEQIIRWLRVRVLKYDLHKLANYLQIAHR